MKDSIKTGISFGLTSGIITTLGLIVGLYSGTHSQVAIIGGILTIAVADAFSDALGIHVSQEAQDHQTVKSVWEATLATFLSKFIFAMTFIIPILIFDLNTAIIISVAWGILALTVFNYAIAKAKKTKPWEMVTEHLVIAVLVILITHFLGKAISSMFS